MDGEEPLLAHEEVDLQRASRLQRAGLFLVFAQGQNVDVKEVAVIVQSEGPPL